MIALAIISIFFAGVMIGAAIALFLLRKPPDHSDQQTLIQSMRAVELLKEEINLSLGRLGEKSRELSLLVQAQRAQQ